MWIRPAILLLVGGLALSQTTPAGAGDGRGHGGRIPGGSRPRLAARAPYADQRRSGDHLATYQSSPAAMAVILVLVAARLGGRVFLQENASSLHIDLLQATDVLLLLAVGMVAAQQLEMWIRARG